MQEAIRPISRRALRFVLPVVVVPLTLLTAGSAGAGVPSTRSGGGAGAPREAGARTWTQVTDAADSRNIDEVGLARTGDGVLHVFWRDRLGPGEEAVRHTPIATTGAVGPSVTAGGPVATAGNPVAIVGDDGDLRVFFAGLTGSESPLDGVLSASSDATGTSWSPTEKVSSTSSAIPEGVGAGLTPDGTPAFTYAYSFVLGYHLGLDPATPDVDLIRANDCCAYGPSLAFTSDAGFVGWFSNVEGAEGWWTQTVYPQVGTAVPAPDPFGAGRWVTPSQRTPLVTRTGTDDVYLAYCSGYPRCESVLLWEVGTPTAEVVAKGPDIEKVNLASDEDGRLWVMYQDGETGRLYASRSDDEATAFVGVAELDPPDGTQAVWHLAGSATDDQLDVVGSFTTEEGIDAWHTVVLPPLHIEPEVRKRATTFAVTDSDGPVKGVTVTYRNRRAVTDGQGLAVVRVKRASTRQEATAAKSGYTPATTSVQQYG